MGESLAFYKDPERYDLTTGVMSGPEIVDFYRGCAVRYGGPVLELATGTGRLAIPIARDGLEVVGLDSSPEMLSRANEKARAACTSVTWVHADMRSFDLGRQFQFIFIASNSLSHLYSRADLEAFLACVRRHMSQTARFVLEVFNPSLALLARPPDQRTPMSTFTDTRSGIQVSISKTIQYDSASQISRETWYFRDESTGEEEAVPLHLRMFFPQEIDALLYYNGFHTEEKFGDYEERPFDHSSRKQIIMCVRLSPSSSTA